MIIGATDVSGVSTTEQVFMDATGATNETVAAGPPNARAAGACGAGARGADAGGTCSGADATDEGCVGAGGKGMRCPAWSRRLFWPPVAPWSRNTQTRTP